MGYLIHSRSSNNDSDRLLSLEQSWIFSICAPPPVRYASPIYRARTIK